MPDELTIRRASTPQDYRACQEAQRRAWGLTEEGYVVPIATLVGAQLHGGLVLGAFLPDGAAVGLSFGFLGRIEGRLGLYSQLTGVVPGYQDRGLGASLKQAQRAIARAEGLPLIAWAFDPLQAGNARFNLGKLGATARRFVADMYGPRSDALNAGATTDRLIVEWETEPGPTRTGPTPEEVARLPRWIDGIHHPHDLPILSEDAEVIDAPRTLLEIPDAIGPMRIETPALAATWSDAVRRAFTAAFAAGYHAVGFVRSDDDGWRRGYYVLEHQSSR